MGEPPKHHEVIEDLCGTGVRRYPRLTCKNEGCNEDTIVRRTWENEAQWARVKKDFLLKHPQAPEPQPS